MVRPFLSDRRQPPISKLVDFNPLLGSLAVPTWALALSMRKRRPLILGVLRKDLPSEPVAFSLFESGCEGIRRRRLYAWRKAQHGKDEALQCFTSLIGDLSRRATG